MSLHLFLDFSFVLHTLNAFIIGDYVIINFKLYPGLPGPGIREFLEKVVDACSLSVRPLAIRIDGQLFLPQLSANGCLKAIRDE